MNYSDRLVQIKPRYLLKIGSVVANYILFQLLTSALLVLAKVLIIMTVGNWFTLAVEQGKTIASATRNVVHL